MDSIEQQAFQPATPKSRSWSVSESAKQISRKKSKKLQNAHFLTNGSAT